jgi:hypothetical protein
MPGRQGQYDSRRGFPPGAAQREAPPHHASPYGRAARNRELARRSVGVRPTRAHPCEPSQHGEARRLPSSLRTARVVVPSQGPKRAVVRWRGALLPARAADTSGDGAGAVHRGGEIGRIRAPRPRAANVGADVCSQGARSAVARAGARPARMSSATAASLKFEAH